MIHRRLGSLVAIVSLALAACAGRPEPKEPTPTTSIASTTAAASPVAMNGDPQAAVTKAHADLKGVTEGKNADYIPVLAKVDSKLFGVVLVTVNGEVYEVGDVQHAFSIQSVSKVFTLGRILEDLGPAAVEKRIGTNATGQAFNSIIAIELNKKNHPAGNPFVNPGAIASVSLVPGATPDERWSRIMGTLENFAGRRLTIDEQVYKSESETNTRNRAISWLLKAYEVIPGDPMEALDLYTRQCSVAVTAHDLAVMGATLANGGTNPLTHQRVVSPENAARVLSVMLTAGFYETTGTWSFDVGVPSKSGVGGGIVAVVPGRYAIGTFAPPLDEAGNSVRGQKAVESIVKSLGGNIFMGSRAQPSRVVDVH